MPVNCIYFNLFFSIYLFIYFIEGRSKNHFCENAPCLKNIIYYYYYYYYYYYIIIIIIII